MKAAVVDTNVGVVANQRETDASPDCVTACVDFLEQVTRGHLRVVVDAGWEILGEYERRLSSSGQPGPGDAFLKWVLVNLANRDRCEQVEIHLHPDRGFEEFPDHPALEGFDPSDRKFAAVAFVSTARPPVANAVDSDWWDYRKPLERHGIRVLFLCNDQVDSWRRER